jgi:hypothetical protein
MASRKLPDKCMELDAVQYIAISGSGSKGFKNLINQIFIDRFNAFVYYD